ncbi:putative oxidoreductase [Vibrio variabilis]|uniref:Oxidoreductase n=1 Tax=Vibrio variabilis TaxID=990271 RepID=A0ABQ0J6L7_9VIBR|nr:putative oxidoreductase [Vibrio variabilis]
MESGINYFDVAPYYGQTKAETALGAALQHHERSKYTIATKIGRYGDSFWDFSRDATLRSVEESLRRLKTETIDVIQCHDIDYGDMTQLRDEALPTLRELQSQGVVKHIGITGYDLSILEDIATQEHVDTVMAFCTYTIQDRRLGAVAKRLRDRGIGVLNASPLCMGLLTRNNIPSWHPSGTQVQETCREAAELCHHFGESIEKLALQFATYTANDHGIDTTVVGISNIEQLKINIENISSPINQPLLDRVQLIMEPILNTPLELNP